MSDEAIKVRRVKKRWIVLGVVGVVLLVAVGLTIRAVVAEPDLSRDVGQELIDHSAQAQAKFPEPDFDAHALWVATSGRVSELSSAAGRAAEDEGNRGRSDSLGRWGFDLGYLGTPAEDELLRKHAGKLLADLDAQGLTRDWARVALAGRIVMKKQEGPLLGWLLPELAGTRAMARAEAARMRLAAASGDWDGMLAPFERLMSISRICQHQPILITTLVGHAVEELARGELISIMNERAVPEPVLVRALEIIDRHSARPPADFVFKGERIGIQDTINRTHSASGLLLPAKMAELGLSNAGGPTGLGAPTSVSPMLNVLGYLAPSKAATEAKFDDLYGRIYLDTARTPRERITKPSDTDVWVEKVPANHLLVKLLMPALSTAQRAFDRRPLSDAGLRTMIAIERHRSRHGGVPPENLARIDPDLKPTLRDDPWTELPFGYRVLKDDPAGRTYVLYAFGLDGKDDGGTPDPKAPEVVLSRASEAQGKDYVLNRPRSLPAQPPAQPPATSP
jgi:hypothetical protein